MMALADASPLPLFLSLQRHEHDVCYVLDGFGQTNSRVALLSTGQELRHLMDHTVRDTVAYSRYDQQPCA
jgi:hypothetical protein